jgi:predicted RNA-binding protein with TRAM domain
MKIKTISIGLMVITLLTNLPAVLKPASAATQELYIADDLELNAGEEKILSAVMDSANGYVYFGTRTQPGKIIKVRLSDFTRVGAITLESGENDLYSGILDPVRGYAYFATHTSPGRVVKIKLDTFTRVGAITLAAGENLLFPSGIDVESGLAYFGTDKGLSAGEYIIKVDINHPNFSRIAAVNLAADEYACNAILLDKVRGYLYVTLGSFSNHGKFARIRLSDFTYVDRLTFLPGENYLGPSVIDPQSGYAYVASSPGNIIKVRLSDFTRVTALNLPSENAFRAGALDLQTGFVYFGTQTSPGKVVRINLETFTRYDGLTLPIGFDEIGAAAIDTTTGCVYFGTYKTSPGKIVKVCSRESVSYPVYLPLILR